MTTILQKINYLFWGQFNQPVYAQLLSKQVPKAQKAAWFDCLIVSLGSACVKAAHKVMVKLTPVLNFFVLQKWHGCCDQTIRVANYLERNFLRKIFCHLNVSLDGGMWNSMLTSRHHGKGQIQMLRIAKSHQNKVSKIIKKEVSYSIYFLFKQTNTHTLSLSLSLSLCISLY